MIRQHAIPRGIGAAALTLAAVAPTVARAQRATVSRFPAPAMREVLPATAPWLRSQPERERATRGRIALQLLGGIAGAGLLGIGAFQYWDDPEGSARRVKGDAGYTPNANTAYAAASWVGGTAATYLIGRSDGSRGSFGATALGVGIATVPLALGRHEPYLPWLGLAAGAPLQAVGGTLGYQLTRRVGGAR